MSRWQAVMKRVMTPPRLTVLNVIPVLFLVHNLEEAFTMRGTLADVRTGMPRLLRVFLPPVSYEQFLVSLLVLTALAFWAARYGRLHEERGWGVYALLGLQVVLFLNVFAHLTTLLVVGHYTAGLVTSLGINLPFSLYVFTRVIRERWIGMFAFALLFPLGVIVHVPILFGVLYLSGYISRALLGA